MNANYENNCVKENQKELEFHLKQIIRLIGEDPEREGLLETPKRVAEMYKEIFSGYYSNINEILSTTFSEDHEELVMVTNINYYSLCEHHMVPFFGKIHIGYLPNKKIVGLSKFARLVDAITKKLQVQERVTSEIANLVEDILNPKGVMVVVEGEHLCMCARGVKKSGTVTITTAVRGDFKENSNLRAEFLALIKNK